MPTYEYQCESCGHAFEAFQRMSDEPLTECPREDCKDQGPVKRLISGGSGLLFKGSGFYLTDYRSESYKAGAKADKSNAGSSKNSSTSKSAKETAQ